MFLIESPNMEKGGKVEWDSLYYLRNVNEQKYLALDNEALL